jgi:D-beta-D-heptose 7-phosphate kinase/D-beta-D-heptose 1-phosphate adenosyltransferase
MFTLPNYNLLNVAVIGDVLLDVYYDCKIERISPEAPVLIAKTNCNQKKMALGGAANVANNCAGLKANVDLYGIVGYDKTAVEMKQLCDAKNIKAHFYASENVSTIHKVRYKKDHNQVIRIDFEGDKRPYKVDARLYYKLQDDFFDNVEKYHLVILSDYNKGTLKEYLCQNIINKCNAYNIPIFVDPKGVSWGKYDRATCLTPNLREFQQMVSEDITLTCNKNIVQAAKEIINDFTLNYLLITKGKQGISFINNNEHFNVLTDAQEVFDVSGAGDTVISTFALSITSGYCNYREAIKLANSAAKVVIKKVGTQAITYAELEREINNQNMKCTTRVMDQERLVDVVNNWKEQGLRVAFTNGCFDILHAGHIFVINEASKSGDKLIVAINSDKSIKRIKGSSRPIISEDQRAAIISNIVGVDAVTVFDEDTPLSLIKKIVPDVLVKGGDYTIDKVVGGNFMQIIDREVKIVPLIEGLSTTEILKQIANNIKENGYDEETVRGV